MATLKDYKATIDSVTETEMSILDSLTYLHAERLRRGITQKELADRIGMSQPQLAKIEKGTSLPSLKTMARYAAGLGLVIHLSFTPVGKRQSSK